MCTDLGALLDGVEEPSDRALDAEADEVAAGRLHGVEGLGVQAAGPLDLDQLGQRPQSGVGGGFRGGAAEAEPAGRALPGAETYRGAVDAAGDRPPCVQLAAAAVGIVTGSPKPFAPVVFASVSTGSMGSETKFSGTSRAVGSL